MRHKLCRLLHVFILKYIPITGLNYIWKIVKFTLNRHLHVYDWKGRLVHKPTPSPAAYVWRWQGQRKPHPITQCLFSTMDTLQKVPPHFEYPASCTDFHQALPENSSSRSWLDSSFCSNFPHTNRNEQQCLFPSVPHKCCSRDNGCIQIIITTQADTTNNFLLLQ